MENRLIHQPSNIKLPSYLCIKSSSPLLYSRTLLLWVYNLSILILSPFTESFLSIYKHATTALILKKKTKNFLLHFSPSTAWFLCFPFIAKYLVELFITVSHFVTTQSLLNSLQTSFCPQHYSNFSCQVSSKNNFDSIPQGTPKDSIGTIQCSLAQRCVVFILWHLQQWLRAI